MSSKSRTEKGTGKTLQLEESENKRKKVITKRTKRSINRCSSMEMPRKASNIEMIKGSSILILNGKIRKDAFGNNILKGSKAHKVTFVDKICSKDLAQVSDYIDNQPVSKKDNAYHLNIKKNVLKKRSLDTSNLEQKSKLNCEMCLIF